MTPQDSIFQYEPPYDSPIEEILAWHLSKYIRQDVSLEKQVEFITEHGVLRVDFLLSNDERKIVIECDGRDFHEPLRDEIRDAILLGEGHVDTIYHFRGCDITHYPVDCVRLISILDPNLINSRGHVQLKQLSQLEISEDSVWKRYNGESFLFPIDVGKDFFFRAFRISNYKRPPHLNYHWKALYEFACEHPEKSLDELFEMELSNLKLERDEPK